MQGTPKCRKYRFVRRFGQGGVRKNSVYQLGFCRFERFRDGKTVDQFGDLGTHQMRTKQFSGGGIEYRFNEALSFTERSCLAVADEGKSADA